MSKSFWSIALVALAVAATLGWPADAQQAPAGPAYGTIGGPQELVTHFLPSEGKATALTIVDPISRRIAVYHIARDSGEIQLKSIRNFTGDFGLDYWNSGSPLPHEIMKGIERSQ